MTRLPALLVLPVVVALLAGCAAPAVPETPTAEAVTVENCGVPVTFDVPPQRVVTIKSTSTEMMLALGVGDRIVGTAFQDGPVPEEWAADAADLPEISDFMPSEEAVLELEPDLVYSGWESAFAADATGERDELAALGVASYVQPAACRSADVPAKLTFDEVFREIQEAADIFGVSADDLLADSRPSWMPSSPTIAGSPRSGTRRGPTSRTSAPGSARRSSCSRPRASPTSPGTST